MTTDSLLHRPVSARAEGLVQPSAADVTVGKDLVELLSAGMYVDPMCIYREYVQNAADAIDQARIEGLLSADEPGRVDIELIPAGRTIRIRDNGAGLRGEEFARTLLAIGGSRKRGMSLRGFRGIGRLAGLAYAQELVFRSRAAGEMRVNELRWDSRRLKAALRDGAFDGGIDKLVLHCAQLRTLLATADYPERFFEVELKGVVRLRADRLMTAVAVEQFLSQHGPVPFSPEFRHGPDIAAALRRASVPPPLEIYLNGSEAPLYRPHRDTLVLGNGRQSSFGELEVREIPDMDGGLAALAWVLHHDYEGAIPQANLVKGLRMRVGDLQVGGPYILEDCFPEARFNAWAVGEVHVLDRRIVPNGRRDDFEQSVHHNNLLNHLSPLVRDISRRCRTNSIRRNWLRKLDAALGKARDGASPASAAAARTALHEAARIASLPLLAGEDVDNRRVEIDGLRETLDRLEASSKRSDPLAVFSPEERKGAERILSLIATCSGDSAAADRLVEQILGKLAG